MTYDTGNPVPSIDPRDLDDNAQAFDRFLQSTSSSEPDRLGVPRKTWHQLEQDASALVAPNVAALAALTLAVNKGLYATGPGALAVFDLAPQGRSFLAATTEALQRTALGLDGPVTLGTVTMTGPLNNAPIQSVASGATVNLAAVTSNTVTVTGTTTITALGSMPTGTRRRLIFSGALILTHNASAIVLPGAANITTAPGDVADFESIGASQWRMVDWLPADGQPMRTVAVTKGGTGQATIADAALALAAPKLPWTSYTPTLTPTSGTFTSISATGSYMVDSGICHFRIAITITTVGTGTYPQASLPFPALAGSAGYTVPAKATTAAVTHGGARISGDLLKIIPTRYDNADFTAAGEIILIMGSYPVA